MKTLYLVFKPFGKTLGDAKTASRTRLEQTFTADDSEAQAVTDEVTKRFKGCDVFAIPQTGNVPEDVASVVDAKIKSAIAPLHQEILDGISGIADKIKGGK